MNPLRRWLVWLGRVHLCRGFGIQSPTDYAFVRYVINEHWPYYAYHVLPSNDWLTRKLGQLYFRLANWRQPRKMLDDEYRDYWKAGCRQITFHPSLVEFGGHPVELARVPISDTAALNEVLSHCNADSVLVVESIYRDWSAWRTLISDSRIGTTFDLYYCGIILFDTHRFSHHYKINF